MSGLAITTVLEARATANEWLIPICDRFAVREIQRTHSKALGRSEKEMDQEIKKCERRKKLKKQRKANE